MERSGFSLVELMVVVAILGVIASTALPAFQRYMLRSRTSEVYHELRQMFDSAGVYFIEDHVLADGTFVQHHLPQTAPPTPATPPPGETIVVHDWSHPTWRALFFVINDPIRYSYDFESDPTEWCVVRAQGDLDGDGQLSLYQRRGVINDTNDLQGQGALYIEDPLE